ncbi:putative RNA recognition motif domain, nucleotide-binding alpha-beta plait domain superfamily [Helianthus anomalus]
MFNFYTQVTNLDERVTDRVLYDILSQVGRVVDLHIPRDRETDKPKGFAFAEYETKEIADYAVKLLSGLVTLYNRTLRFGVSYLFSLDLLRQDNILNKMI